MRKFMLAAVAAGALALAGCQTVDSKAATASDQLAAQCTDLKAATAIAGLVATGSARDAVRQAEVILVAVCANPSRDAATAVVVVAGAIVALQEDRP